MLRQWAIAEAIIKDSFWQKNCSSLNSFRTVTLFHNSVIFSQTKITLLNYKEHKHINWRFNTNDVTHVTNTNDITYVTKQKVVYSNALFLQQRKHNGWKWLLLWYISSWGKITVARRVKYVQHFHYKKIHFIIIKKIILLTI